MSLFLFLSDIHRGDIVGKVYLKARSSEKYKKGDSHIGGLSIEGGGGSNLLHTMTFRVELEP